MGDYVNINGVDFPYLEEVPSMIQWEGCVNADKELVVMKGRRRVL